MGDPLVDHRDRLGLWVRAQRAWQRRGGSMPQPPPVEDVQWLLDDRDVLLLALRDARDALTERGDTCTARAANAPGGENACPAVPCACDLEGKADGLAGGALAINAIITRFWGEEAVLWTAQEEAEALVPILEAHADLHLRRTRMYRGEFATGGPETVDELVAKLRASVAAMLAAVAELSTDLRGAKEEMERDAGKMTGHEQAEQAGYINGLRDALSLFT